MILIVLLLTLTFIVGVVQMHMLASAMKFFDQMEVMPIYQTGLMFSWIVSGMIIYKET